MLSGVTGFVGMNVSVKANVRTAEAARTRLQGGLTMAFRSGAITGMLVAGLGLLAIAGFFWYLIGPAGHAPNDRIVIDALVALAFGASLISIFARLGGGIFTKAADVGADLVGKVEAGIPEDDPRNPATIADNVGDNVGDCAGMAADLFETYVVTLGVTMVSIALTLAGVGRRHAAEADDAAADRRRRLHRHLDHRHLHGPPRQGPVDHGRALQGLLDLRDPRRRRRLFRHPICARRHERDARHDRRRRRRHGHADRHEAVLLHADRPRPHRRAGLDHRILYRHQLPAGAQSIAKASQTGHGTNVIQGLAISLESTALPTLVIVIAVIGAYQLAGVIGVAFGATAMLALAGMVVALDAYGPVTDNAGGIAEMAGLPDEVRVRTDALDAVGNTTKAVTKGYAIGSAALAALVLFGAYTTDLGLFFPNVDGRFLAEQPLRHRRPAARRAAALQLRRLRHDRGRPRRRRGGRGRPRPVPRQSGDHGRHQPAQLRPHRRSRHPRRDPRDDHPLAAAGAGADRGLFHHHLRSPARPRASPRSARCCSA